MHNFLAGAKTLIEHTRGLSIDLYSETPFIDEYQSKINESFGAPICGFISCLRNWIVHKGLLPVTIQTSLNMTGGPNSTRVVLPRAALETWDRWDPRAKQFLEHCATNIPLDDLIQGYGEKVTSFYDWLGKRMEELHAEAFNELEELQEQYKKVKPIP